MSKLYEQKEKFRDKIKYLNKQIRISQTEIARQLDSPIKKINAYYISSVVNNRSFEYLPELEDLLHKAYGNILSEFKDMGEPTQIDIQQYNATIDELKKEMGAIKEQLELLVKSNREKEVYLKLLEKLVDSKIGG